ncbi:hypothetical protein A3K69_04300 [Candidatus Bathyarchaeota archaeon RBG_16_57_9]|nr:MAG: hypothetical protein A3K69_04300 [Candidatus Bathyarchaeota archaeon RBG_16_57_9]
MEGKQIENCYQSGSFPYKMLVDFSKTRPHRALGLKNLFQLRDIAFDEWLKGQEKRWTCPSCGKRLLWYAKKCLTYGAKLTTATQEAQS